MSLYVEDNMTLTVPDTELTGRDGTGREWELEGMGIHFGNGTGMGIKS